MELPAPSPSPWPARRRRAEQLRERHAFAAEVLDLYLALLDVQEPVYEAALADRLDTGDLPRMLAQEVLPRIVAATVAAGPPALAAKAPSRLQSPDLEDLVCRWLQGKRQEPVDRYLARAAAAPVLEALEPAALSAVCARAPQPRSKDESVPLSPTLPRRGGGSRDGRASRCPHCGGPPQVSFDPTSGEALVTATRRLVCARCARSWTHTRMVCAGCGESTGAKLPVYADEEWLPHLRVEGCETCRSYLISVDARRDAAAIPEVDELAALPLDLFASERGLRKVTPNLMGM